MLNLVVLNINHISAVGMFTFMSKINFNLICVEHDKCVLASKPDVRNPS